MTEKDYFRGVAYTKKFAKFPIKEKINIFHEGSWIWQRYYFEWYIPGARIF